MDWATATKSEKRAALRQWFKDNKHPLATYNKRCQQFDEAGRWDEPVDLVEVCRQIYEEFGSKPSNTERRMKMIYGEEYGVKKWQHYCDQQAYTNSQEYHNMTDEEFKAYNKSRACTKENFIKRHGEEDGLKRWDAYVARQIETKSKPYWVTKYGEEEWVAHCKRLYPKNPAGGYSSVSQDAFDKIAKLIPEEVQYATHGGEMGIYTKNGSYLYDCCIPDAKVVVEFQGDMWHANPAKYQPDDHPHIHHPGITAADIWAYDEHKRKTAEEQGYRVLYLWESDYRKDPEGALQRLVEQIKPSPVN